MNKIYYVYGHYDNQGILRYIGSGTNNRPYSFSQRQNSWNKVFVDKKPIVKIFKTYVIEKEAREEEKRLIIKYRNDNLLNVLTNTQGFGSLTKEEHKELSRRRSGDNHWNIGGSRSVETKKKISESKKKNPTRYWLGKKRDPELMRKMTEAAMKPEAMEKRLVKLRGRKQSEEEKAKRKKSSHKKAIVCINTGKIYESLSEASKILNISCGHICENLKGKRKTVKKMRFQYI